MQSTNGNEPVKNSNPDDAVFYGFFASDSGTNLSGLPGLKKKIIDPTPQDLGVKVNGTDINGKKLVLFIDAHGGESGKIFLVKNASTTGYIPQPVSKVIVDILLMYRDVPDIDRVEKTIILSQCYAGSIRKQLEHELEGGMFNTHKGLFTNLKNLHLCSQEICPIQFVHKQKIAADIGTKY